MYLWTKALHIIFMVTWFAGLFYLPRLYVYHSEAKDLQSVERFKIMERRLYFGIMLPALLLTLSSGLGLILIRGSDWLANNFWMHLKLALVFSLIVFHLYLGCIRKNFAKNENRKSSLYFKILNEIPVFFLVAITLLAVVKPW